MIAVCCVVSSVFALMLRTVGQPLLLTAYGERFDFIPGHWFGERVARLRDNSDTSCIILGASTAREGFDPNIIEQRIPGISVLNAATTGGNNEVLEIQSAILARYAIKPRCIVAGISTWMMFRDGSPPIIGEEYLGLMEWDEVFALASQPLFTRQAPRIAVELILPLRSQALQLNRLIRKSVSDARASTIGRIPLGEYEVYPNELQPSGDYLYSSKSSNLVRDWSKLSVRTHSLYPPSRFGGSMQERSLHKTLDRLLSLSSDITLVIMPQTPILASASRSGSPFFWQAFARYSNRIHLIDCSGLTDLKMFVDEGHLNAQGRGAISAEVGLLLGAHLLSRRSGKGLHRISSQEKHTSKSSVQPRKSDGRKFCKNRRHGIE